jgi:DNA repair photolyase
MPLRLDSYSRCQYACRYCFASARGGAVSSANMQTADSSMLARRLQRLETNEPRSALDEMLSERIPIHFGGMSDPFPPMERSSKVSLQLLEVLAEFQYPTIISTKGTLVGEPRYARILEAGNFLVQMSVTSNSDADSSRVDVGAPTTSERLLVVESLSLRGIRTAIRHQPMIPTREGEAVELVHRAASAGARHFSAEHLKVPIERNWAHKTRLSEALGFDIGQFYNSHGAKRVGREWVLPVELRLPIILMLRNVAHDVGMSFGAADTDLLHFSDGQMCCSGADLMGFNDGFGFNFLSAVHNGMHGGKVRFDSIERKWRPHKSIAEYINSNSRKSGNTLDDFIRARWNGVQNGPSPETFFGVVKTEFCDSNEFRIYEIQPKARQLYNGRWNDLESAGN